MPRRFSISNRAARTVWALVAIGATLWAGLQFDDLAESLVPAWLVAALALAVLAVLLNRRWLPGTADKAPVSDDDLLIHYAYHDALTKLPNRMLLRDRLSVQLAAMSRAKTSVALLMIDLDDFKRINDGWGHLAGDQLLVEVARRLCQSCRDTDTVARLGGDEFVLIQSLEDPNQAALLGNRIIANLAQPFELDKGQVEIGCSIGATITHSPGISLEELIDQADFALYSSKRMGGNTLTLFDPATHLFNRSEKHFETELVRAIESHHLELHFSRQVDLSGQLIGIDTTLAWDHASLGRLTLPAILGSVYDRRLANSTAEYYLATVAETSARLPALQMTFNALPLLNPDRHLVETLCHDTFNLLRRAASCYLALSLADFERGGMRAVALAEELESQGYGLLLDCSESSLDTLRTIARLRPSRLRINSHLTGALTTAGEALASVRALCAMARSNGIETIADGVENAEQSTILTDLGCAVQQGPLWGRGSDLGKLTGSSDRSMQTALS